MTDYVTLEAIRTRRKIAAAGAAAFDARWAELPSAVSRWLDQQCDRPLYRDADETRYFDPFHAVDGRALIVDDDLASVTSVTINDAGVDSADFILSPQVAPFHAITLRRKIGRMWSETSDEGGIVVVGRWCMLPDGDGRLDLLYEAALVLALFAVDHGDAGAFQTVIIPDAGMTKIPTGFPKMVVSMIEKWRRLPY